MEGASVECGQPGCAWEQDMAQRAWTFTTAHDRALMLKPSHLLGAVIDEYHHDAAILESTQRTYASLHALFTAYLQPANAAPPTLTAMTHEHPLAFSRNFPPANKEPARSRE